MKFPIFQFVPITSLPFTRQHWEESGSVVFTPPSIYTHDKTCPEPSPCWSVPGLSAACMPDTPLKPLLGSPELDPALHMWPHQSWLERKDHLPPLAGKALPCAVQEVVGLSVTGVHCGSYNLMPTSALYAVLNTFSAVCYISPFLSNRLPFLFLFWNLGKISISLIRTLYDPTNGRNSWQFQCGKHHLKLSNLSSEFVLVLIPS